MPALRRLLAWCRERFVLVGPEAVDQLRAPGGSDGARDRLLFTFDDGHRDQFEGGRWLASEGVRGVFFVTPPYLERTTEEFVAHHAARGVRAYPLGIKEPARSGGMTFEQVRELDRLGHLVAAHNYAHRDLGRLTSVDDLDYEVGQSLDDLSDLLGKPCRDFAISFGTPRHLSPEALAYLQARCRHVYTSVRGLNVPGLSPSCFTRDEIRGAGPEVFNRAGALGAFDDRARADRAELIRRAGVLCPADARAPAVVSASIGLGE